jgi:hypothetical protein
MKHSGGTGFAFFIDTGRAEATTDTWIWTAEETWTRVSIAIDQAGVFGIRKRVYAMYAWACGGCLLDPALQSAPQLGISGCARMSTSPEMAIGPAQTATVFDGTHYIVLTANWRGGLWRLVE